MIRDIKHLADGENFTSPSLFRDGRLEHCAKAPPLWLIEKAKKLRKLKAVAAQETVELDEDGEEELSIATDEDAEGLGQPPGQTILEDMLGSVFVTV